MTGADRPFEGKHGLMDLITGSFALEALPGCDGGRFRTPEVQLKYWLVAYNLQLAVWAALELRTKVDWRELASVTLGTNRFGYTGSGSEPEKWDPQTRETADHSLPYVCARTLVDGTIALAAFDEAAYRDPFLRPLMSKIRVHEDDEVNALYPETVAMTVEAATIDGKRITFRSRDPLGHSNNPLQDEDVRAKFRGAAEPVLGADRAAAALECWWNLPSVADLAAAFALLDHTPNR
jgi:2-methylcitrate dehydratase